tara:strand:+ start:2318 stop:4141 length:1824 start_codon:yes stop_codon:yes gene_type:complete
MRRFILIDNWLDSVGGHNYQYAMEILQAAADSNHKVVLATAKSFANKMPALPETWRCFPIFKYSWNRTHSVGVDGKRNEPIDIHGQTLKDPSSDERKQNFKNRQGLRLFQAWDRKRRIRAFSDACQRLFNQIGLERDDILFFPSVSDFDFLGLAAFLASNKATQSLHWHVQFHYDIFDGRPPQFDEQQERKLCMERQFSQALAAIQTHRLHFYATTPQIAEQYNRLNVAAFSPLPYPIRSLYLPDTSSRLPKNKPLRVTLAGAPRREKGKRELNQLFGQLQKLEFAGKTIQLRMQGQHRAITRQLSDFDPSQVVKSDTPAANSAPIVVVPHPLKRQKYLEYIQQTDIGLLPYNNARYHARASGVLIEMLSAGVPIIVTAGSWLALQLAEPIYQHLDSLIANLPTLGEKCLWPFAAPANTISQNPDDVIFLVGGNAKPCSESIQVPSGSHMAIVQIPWREQRPGHFIGLRVVQRNRLGQTKSKPHASILCPREQGKPIAALVELDPKSDSIRIEISNAYHNHSMVSGIPQITFFQESVREIPTGAVGLIASHMHQVPALLEEMVLHHDHYKGSAAKFSESWNFKHSPLRTIEILMKHQNNTDELREVA